MSYNPAIKIKQITKPGFSNRSGANKRLLEAKKSNKKQMNCGENECTPQGIRIYSGEVTSRYKGYLGPVPVGLLRFSDGLVINRAPS